MTDQNITLTPLFSDLNYNGQVQLLARNETTTFQISIQKIQYYFFIGKLPTWKEEDFKSFLRRQLPDTTKIQLHEAIDAESFVFQQKWPFYKIIDSIENIKQILGNKNINQTIEYKTNNYFLQDYTGKQLLKKIQVSKLFLAYYNEYNKIDCDKLMGVEKLMYSNLQYPFRYEGQDIQSIQIKYQLCFSDTLNFSKFKEIEIPNSIFKYDKVIQVNINNITQVVPSQMDKYLQYYKICMFDIENVVVKSSEQTFTKWHAVRKQLDSMDSLYRQLANNLQKSKNVQTVDDTYVGKMDLNSKDKYFKQVDQKIDVKKQSESIDKFNDKCCDQNEIICISFIISNFQGDVIEKIALTRSEYKTDKKYADRVISVNTESELIREAIKLINHKDYNIIMHFNGWDFDERMICIRAFMYNQIEEYLSGMGLENQLSKSNFKSDGMIKISGSRTLYNLFQIIGPRRFSFDVMIINQILNTEAERMDSNKLTDLLKLNKLEDKEGITYQQVTDRFLEYKNAYQDLKNEGLTDEQIKEFIINEGSELEELEDQK